MNNWYKTAQWNDKGISGKEALNAETEIRNEFLQKHPNIPTIPQLSQFIKAKENSKYPLVNINVQKFDQLFQKDTDFYIGKNGTQHAIGNRYQRFQDFLRTNTPIEAPFAFIDEDLQRAGFNNGRHRYAVLRDMGMTTMPVSIDNDSLKRARKLGLLA